MKDEEVIGVLNDLIETCKDGEYGFAKCAERVNTASLKGLMLKRSAGCRSAARELQSLVVRHGGEPTERGSVLGALHRGWVSVGSAQTPTTPFWRSASGARTQRWRATATRWRRTVFRSRCAKSSSGSALACRQTMTASASCATASPPEGRARAPACQAVAAAAAATGWML